VNPSLIVGKKTYKNLIT